MLVVTKIVRFLGIYATFGNSSISLAQGEHYMKMAAGEGLFVVALALYPNFAVVGFDNTASNGQPQARPSPFENGFA
jgi:hypothetical protein